MKIRITTGDIGDIKADALIATLSVSGHWYGNINRVITRRAKDHFHNQVRRKFPLDDGDIIIATGDNYAHEGAFHNVVFIMDDLRRPLNQVIQLGLIAAFDAGYQSVTLPMYRTAELMGLVERTKRDIAEELALGTRLFVTEHPQGSLEDIIFVIWNDHEMENLLRTALGQRELAIEEHNSRELFQLS